ncbi:lasso peptide biosynthesis B2 protein [Paraburkholderia sp. CNPSo 3076]|uniref:lasso peptide biosynthesis B2 protein n=1 Tax=Paraburkholderia sp. CNPSo 3076 TaxID=2940936 RepID=UPI00225576F6|nr:lasso peptide biosynthesis B2 protein [Paraburkholderia sp. CNPSo 3076]MCX5544047.1 lasso peptide biosynthesis B2 protein [Paraburkholderia sp. CNPSo 3076]
MKIPPQNMNFVWFDDQLIGLDIAHDRYIVLPPDQSRTFIAKHLAISACRYDAQTCAPPQLSGVPVNCWKLSPGQVRNRLNIIESAILFTTLHKVHETSRNHRLSGLLQLIESERIQRKNKRIIRNENDLAASLNLTCFLYPVKTKCLEWACTLIIAGYRYGLDMKLVIGIQNRPFFAHAWAELDGRVVGDDPARRRQLAVIHEMT